MVSDGAEDWEEIRDREENLLNERFLLRILEAARPPLWALLEAAEHFFHACEPQRSQAFLAKAAQTGFEDPLLDELRAKAVWTAGDHDAGLRLAREAAAKWQRGFLRDLVDAMETGDEAAIMEPAWQTGLLKREDQIDELTAARLRLSGPALDSQAITAALGVEPDWSEPGIWALETLGSGSDTAEVVVKPLLERMAKWPAGASLKNIPGVDLAVLEILMIGRRDTGEKANIACVLKPAGLTVLADLGVVVKMMG